MPLDTTKAEKASFIHNQLSQLDQQIQKIITDRVSLLDQLNDLQSSDAILPDEILSFIFIKAYEESSVSPIILGAVCSRWRRVAWDTPPLWSAIGPIPPRRLIRQSDVEMLKLYFQNTTQHPIHLNLDLNSISPKHPVTKALISVIFAENSLKLGKLTLSTTHSNDIVTKMQQAIEQSDMSNLSTISYVARKKGSVIPIPSPFTNLYHSAVNLRTLMIDSCQLPPFEQISWSPITILKLRKIPLNQCLHLLSQCPKMVEFHCHSTYPPVQRLELQVHSKKELRDLEVFDVDLDCIGLEYTTPLVSIADSISPLLQYFRFPNLKHMSWGTLPVKPRHLFTSFLGDMKSLITFKCKSFHNDGELVPLFQLLRPTVRKIYLPFISRYDPERCPHLLKLIATMIEPSSQGMRTLELVFPDSYREIIYLDLPPIVEDFRNVGVHLEISKVSDYFKVL